MDEQGECKAEEGSCGSYSARPGMSDPILGMLSPGDRQCYKADRQCYKLYTRRTENNSMPRFPIPEILRTPLEQLFLQVKAMDEDLDVMAFLRYVAIRAVFTITPC